MRSMLAVGQYDVLLLDLMLPDESGLDLCRWIRRSQSPLARMPVLMLTARGDAGSRILGLELGADDYLPKPFEPRELVARINALTRRRAADATVAPLRPDRYEFSGWQFDRLLRQLITPERVVLALSSAEFRLLCAFVEHPRQALGRERLIELTRAAHSVVSDRSIDLAVSRLRQKLAQTDAGKTLIRTLRSEGYFFDAQVQMCGPR